VAVATSIAAVVVLAAAVLVPRVLAERQPTADRPLPLPRSVVTKPDQGFELTIPDGWKISELDGPSACCRSRHGRPRRSCPR
jgi:hypothetical protein